MPGRGEGSSRAMLATARPSCIVYNAQQNDVFHHRITKAVQGYILLQWGISMTLVVCIWKSVAKQLNF